MQWVYAHGYKPRRRFKARFCSLHLASLKLEQNCVLLYRQIGARMSTEILCHDNGPMTEPAHKMRAEASWAPLWDCLPNDSTAMPRWLESQAKAFATSWTVLSVLGCAECSYLTIACRVGLKFASFPRSVVLLLRPAEEEADKVYQLHQKAIENKTVASELW